MFVEQLALNRRVRMGSGEPDANRILRRGGKRSEHGPAFVLGGWVALDETWVSFAAAWNAVLARYGVTVFHHSDAMALAGPFASLCRASCDSMMSELIGVIETHHIDGYFVHLHHESFRGLWQGVILTKEQGRRLYNKPFHPSFHALVQTVLQELDSAAVKQTVSIFVLRSGRP